ncbi:MAG: helix-turn-helix transcriptional regulator, partial [Pseudomonadota bacterium]
ERVWQAIDRLAQAHDLTPSGLARKAGLDSTTFNKSKRVAVDGRERWPSTESISKVIEATGVSVNEFMAMIDEPSSSIQGSFAELGGEPAMPGVPLLGMAQAGAGGFFDDAGYPVGEGWELVPFPGPEPKGGVYALEISGDSMLPLYRDGDVIIVSPSASIRRGDRVVVKTQSGEVMAKILRRQTTQSIDLQSMNPEHEDRHLPLSDVDWIARILWASQ